MEAYEHAIQLEPSKAIIWNGKGYALISLERFEEALEAYEQVIQLEPSDQVYYQKGNILASLKKY